MIEITTGPARENCYGLLRESFDVVTITGPRVHNSGYQHTVQIWEDGRVVTAGQATVIALAPVARPKNLGTVRPGDQISVDGKVFTVATRDLCDPILIPAS